MATLTIPEITFDVDDAQHTALLAALAEIREGLDEIKAEVVRNRPVVPTRRKEIKLIAGTGEMDDDGVEWWELPDGVVAISTTEDCRLSTKDAVGEVTTELMVAGTQKVGVFTAVAVIARRPDVICYLR
jgi:hypothetical protein